MASGSSDFETERILEAKNYFEVLEVSLDKDVSVYDIKRAYRRLIVLIHPDRNNHPKAEKAFDELQNAYALLSNEDALRTFQRAQQRKRDNKKKNSKWDIREEQDEMTKTTKRGRDIPDSYEDYVRKKRYARMDDIEKELERLKEEKEARQDRRMGTIWKRQAEHTEAKFQKEMGDDWKEFKKKRKGKIGGFKVKPTKGWM